MPLDHPPAGPLTFFREPERPGGVTEEQIRAVMRPGEVFQIVEFTRAGKRQHVRIHKEGETT